MLSVCLSVWPRSFWRWVPDVNYLYYTVNYLVVEEVKSMEFCLVPPTQCELNATEVVTVDTGDCVELLRTNGFDPDRGLGSCLLAHVVTNVVCRVLAYFGLHYAWTGQSCRQRCRD
eukprot:SAG22_NODE_1766_length_3623_cov_2.997162_1_plen_116_part_00